MREREMIEQHGRETFSQAFLVAVALASLMTLGPATTQAAPPQPTIKYFSVSSDQTLTYPSTLRTLPDEHTTFIPLTRPDFRLRPPGVYSFLIFASSSISGGSGGAVALQTSDLQTFDFATALGYDEQVMAPPVLFSICDPTFDSEFDENYAAPGTVVQDPTRPLGNLMMFYEAENHCPGGQWQQPFYATIGFARSSDFGRTWPQPVNSEFGGEDRYPILKLPAPEPASEPVPAAMGDAIPSAIVDGNYVYVMYVAPQGPNAVSDGLFRIARAKLGDDDDWGDDQPGRDEDRGGDRHRLHFLKWYNGAFSEPGIGGNDSGVLPERPCTGHQGMASITRNDDLGLFLLTYVCSSDTEGAWYYSTATSLELQDWAQPQMILNSQFPVTTPCPGLTSGGKFDGWYPSFVSPRADAGHTRLTGRVFFMNGCDTGLDRSFMSRSFMIAVGP
jgi:hypothetical protein